MSRHGGRRLLLIVSGGIAFALLAMLAYAGLSRVQETSLEGFGPAPSFLLTDQRERPVRSEQLRGKVVIANFIYTHCPDICPVLSVQMQ